MSASIAPLILTLKFDSSTFKSLNQLRQQHFPPERNFLPAHITLFHALPGEEAASIQQTLQADCVQTAVLPLSFPQPQYLGRGVAIAIHSPPLVQLRQSLAARWNPWLTRQDQQGYRPHVTIQNKVDGQRARQLYQQLEQDWQPFEGYGEGLLLWYYRGGPWELLQEFSFVG
ncbi:MAG: 2'-5' RNA ligase family protein [Oculatellaceae cyanobacterium Prado106]|nr:2'-5' RNA ligase family protein [Oculatellaceae cyanobacterium Prado106]